MVPWDLEGVSSVDEFFLRRRGTVGETRMEEDIFGGR